MMKTKLGTRAIAFVMIGAFLMAVGTAATFAQGASDDSSIFIPGLSVDPLVGVWEAENAPMQTDCSTGEPIPGAPMLRVMSTFSQGGTGWLEDTSPLEGAFKSTGATVWNRISHHRYQYTNTHYCFLPDNTFVFTLTQRSNVRLNRRGDSIDEDGRFEVKIPDGTVTMAGCFRRTSHRITLSN